MLWTVEQVSLWIVQGQWTLLRDFFVVDWRKPKMRLWKAECSPRGQYRRRLRLQMKPILRHRLYTLCSEGYTGKLPLSLIIYLSRQTSAFVLVKPIVSVKQSANIAPPWQNYRVFWTPTKPFGIWELMTRRHSISILFLSQRRLFRRPSLISNG